jgi:hypothetical protein
VLKFEKFVMYVVPLQEIYISQGLSVGRLLHAIRVLHTISLI